VLLVLGDEMAGMAQQKPNITLRHGFARRAEVI
jgi:hypothetical protein